MGLIIAFGYPIELVLEHDDVVTDTHIDQWGAHDVYQISKVYWAEKSGQNWTAVVKHPVTGRSINQSIAVYESGSKNIPPPARFNSYPLEIHCSLFRG